MRSILILLSAILYLGCTSSDGELHVNYIGNDSCMVLKEDNQPIMVNRRFTIIENTLSDTVSIGGIVAPGYTGPLLYLLVDRRVDFMLYPETSEYRLPKTGMICIRQYAKKKVTGTIKIRYSK